MLYASGAVVALVAVGAAVVASSGFQTWAARRALARATAWNATVGKVSAGFHRVAVTDLRLERAGARLHLPEVTAELPVLPAAFSGELDVRRCVARGWTLDLSQAPAASSPPAATPSPHAVSAAREMFAGVFRQLELPFDLAVDGLELVGEVVLPDARGRVAVQISGGGLRAGAEGKFVVTARAALRDPDVSGVEVHGTVAAAMPSTRSFGKVALQFDATARGQRFPQGLGLKGEVAATRGQDGETYVARLGGSRNLVDLHVELPSGGERLAGAWKLDVRDADVAPFSLGVPVPEFALVGDGVIDADAAFTAIHLAGRLDATVDRWHVVRKELAALGRLQVTADFDLTEQGGTLGVRKLDLAVRGAAPLAEVRSLQAFDFTPATRALRTADTERDLLGIVLHAVPVDWVRPWIADVQVSGGRVRGGLTARAHQGGISLRSTTPLTVEAVGVSRAGRPLLRDIDLSLRAAADFTPQGWQADLSEAAARSGHAELADFEFRLGRLAAAGQPVKLAGRASLRLPVLVAQPGLAGSVALRSGAATVEFAATLDGKRELQAKADLRDLSVFGPEGGTALPAIATQLRADLSPEGAIAFNAPVTLVHRGRTTALALVGTLGAERNGTRAVEAELRGSDVYWEDARLLAAALPEASGGAQPAPPPWSGLHGAVALRLQRVVYSDALEVKDVGGKLRLDAGIVRLEGGQASVGERGKASVNGLVTFDAGARPAYGVIADVAVRDFDFAPLLRPPAAGAKPTVEGRFDLQSRLAGHAGTLRGLIEEARGDVQLTSKGGVFRGLPVNVSTITETTSRWTAWLATAGSALNAVTGRRDAAEIASKTEAVAEVARALHPIVYDQLSFVLARDAEERLHVREFALISPELRLSGQGAAEPRAEGEAFDPALKMEFVLRARGRQAELLKFLGVLETQSDDLGYAACTVPLHVNGTVARPDTAELSGRLSALAIEKSGLGEKAAEFLAWIRGGK